MLLGCVRTRRVEATGKREKQQNPGECRNEGRDFVAESFRWREALVHHPIE